MTDNQRKGVNGHLFGNKHLPCLFMVVLGRPSCFLIPKRLNFLCSYSTEIFLPTLWLWSGHALCQYHWSFSGPAWTLWGKDLNKPSTRVPKLLFQLCGPEWLSSLFEVFSTVQYVGCCKHPDSLQNIAGYSLECADTTAQGLTHEMGKCKVRSLIIQILT